MRMILALVLAFTLAGCGGTAAESRPTSIAPAPDPEPVIEEPVGLAEAEPPAGQLPTDIAPTHYDLALTIVPGEETFSGTTNIDVTLTEARRVIWLHGNELVVQTATITPAGGEAIEAVYEQLDDTGVAKLTLASPVGPGEAVLRFEYTAPFDRSLSGLYRVDEAGENYAFTQFEATSARRAFPGFDEPRFKVPFDVTLTVRQDHEAVANTPERDRQDLPENMRRVRYATTRPMPTYLLAWAVGPLDIVEHAAIPANDVRARPLPLRGVAVRGRGERLAFALDHTGAFLAMMEEYFGIEYPYAKLDIVAVPDFAAGAMENIGLITFRETLLLLDESAPERQRRAYAGVMAHELAHMWFGNLVTMPWWDDIWLNEAFATWMGHKAVQAVHPEHEADLSLLGSVHGAMRSDSLVSARQIRQPIESNHDIRNAFDGITYRKGGGVLSMVERWLGEDTFREGMRHYMSSHAFGSATADDLLAALTEKAGRDVGTPFRTFLEQPGLPFVQVGISCEGDTRQLTLQQSRYLPVGSTGDRAQSWQLPMCARYGVGSEIHETCTLLTEASGTMALEGDACPDWVMPNANGAGYFRFSLGAEDLAHLRGAGWSHLTAREKLALADSLRAAFENGSLAAADLYANLEPLARDDVRQVATAPMGLLSFARDRLVEEDQRAAVQQLSKNLYQPVFRRLGWGPRRGRSESGETALLRASVISHLAFMVEHPRVRRHAMRRAHAYLGYGPRGDGEIHPDAVDANLVATVLSVAVQDGDAAFFDHLMERFFATEDAMLRDHLIGALGSTKDPELAARALAMALDQRVRVNEMSDPLRAQMGMRETRDVAWQWLVDHFEAVVERVGHHRAGYLPYFARGFCDEAKSLSVATFFTLPVEVPAEEEGGAATTLPRIDTLPGGPRNLASSLEGVRLCAARVEAQRESARAFFSR